MSAEDATYEDTTDVAEVDAFRHSDKRTNIPTGELSDFVADDEREPRSASFARRLLYPRDPAADPQLVWRGKDEQDESDLQVPSVPIYIQEKVKPQALIDDLRRYSRRSVDTDESPSLFDDFDGLDFDELVDFYHHNANWSNRLILGDSLLAMTSLAEKEGLGGKVQTVFIDPPYGIKFGSNWQQSTNNREVQDGRESDLTRQPEQIRAFRDTWRDGVHTYLGYLRDRLMVTHQLLNETGSVFVQIGDENVHLVRSLMDEVFGRENFVSLITFKKTTSATGDLLAGTTDFLVWYAKDRNRVKFNKLYKNRPQDLSGPYSQIELPDGTRRRVTRTERVQGIPEGARIFRLDNITSQSAGREKGEGAASWFPVEYADRTFRPSMQSRWKTNESGMQNLLIADRIGHSGNTLGYIRFADDFPVFPLSNMWDDTTIAGFGPSKRYVVQTSTKVVERCLLMTTDPGDVVLDPTCGSGTTAFVAEQWGRRWITVDTSRVAVTITRARMMSARFPYYILADSEAGRKLQAELSAGLPDDVDPPTDNIRQGFVCKRIPHITLRSIAQNPDIKPGMTREEVDEAISRHADFEVLHDQPYEDRKRVRVAGPFTVESLAPHRVVDPAEERPVTEASGEWSSGSSYEQTILDHLRKAGVQNTVKDERLTFETLEAHPGAWLQAAGEYETSDGYTRRVAVSLGPHNGTVGPEQIKEAAKEALRGAGFDLLLVLGFAFDGRAGEVASEFAPDVRTDESAFTVRRQELKMGKLPVLLVHMNPDLQMGDTLLKNTGVGNMFMVFGEPDVDIANTPEGDLKVEIRGVDVFDPTTGSVRSRSTSHIDCWFIDTEYNNESFFVRHAYFAGDEEPFKRLSDALQSEIDKSAWKTLHSTVSRPFARPSTGKIAIKVINYYGDEVMKVYDVDKSSGSH
ncbi:site-specific DNA-methyltransferase [Blastococcus sp. TF02A-26]|uniref:site-specific DNA-methyltransferase n=1 Tax=Blastococcus sp. TF02A-26 TaxID=2250577 RepID=UPI000DE862C5|nr:site-specific DNA-methyltransferase [Blastococcus sp. TF02A-26]RBY86776.1 site-specific DNA-methyltransferase [Blastococcus sp. TF02A-26]